MLHEIWQKTREQHRDRIALWHADAVEGITFQEIDDRSRAIKTDRKNWLEACGDEIDFFPIIAAGWREEIPVLLLESTRSKTIPIDGPLPSGTMLIKQSCGASGVERSLFFGAKQIIAEANRNVNTMSLRPDRRGMAAISMSHSYGFGCLALPLLTHGVPVEVVRSPLPMFMQQCLEKDGPCFLPGVPALWKHWWHSGVLSARTIKLAVSAGSPLSCELEQGIWNDTGIKLHNFYGSTETGAIAFDQTETPREDDRSVGTVLDGVEKKIDEEGRLLVRSDGVATGSDKWLREGEFIDEYYRTWDLADEKDDGILWIRSVGRAINAAGRKVSPDKIQRICQSIPGVVSATVEGIPGRDSERVEEIRIAVQHDGSITLKELKSRMYERLESWEMPRKWEEV